MALNPIGIMALFIALFALIKIIVLLINPKHWMKVVRFIYGNPKTTSVISLILAAITLYYLLQQLTIVHIFAVILFLWLLMILCMSAYSKETMIWTDKMLSKKDFVMRSWFPIILWIVLIAWVLYTMFS